MIDAWHLVWIVPAVGAICFCFGAMLAGRCGPPDNAPDPPTDTGSKDYCAVCPFNPHEGDDENG